MLISQHLTAPVPSVRAKIPTIPPITDKYIARLMAKNPEERPANAAEVIHEVQRHVSLICPKKLDSMNILSISNFLRDVLKNNPANPHGLAQTQLRPAPPIIQPSSTAPSVRMDITLVDINSPAHLHIASALRQQRKQPGVIKVLIVDDSSLMRKAIQHALQKYADIEVVGMARNGEEALEVIPKLEPHVVTLDVNMPGMDGLTTLKHIAVHCPRPVVMLSAFTQEGSNTTFDCLTLGAIDFICKPSQTEGKIEEQIESLVAKIRAASRVSVKPAERIRVKKSDTFNVAEEASARPKAEILVVMGGGKEVYATYLRTIPYVLKSIPCAILAFQPMDINTFKVFCQYLNTYSRIIVKELEDREVLKKGVCYLLNAPVTLSMKTANFGCYCGVSRSQVMPRESMLDSLFQLAAETFRSSSIGVLLTGEEEQGLRGLMAIREAGGFALLQDPSTCFSPENIYRALECKCIDKLVSEVDIPAVLWHLVKEK
jgi:two-component system chemotaxis response regulator CheB